MRNFRIVYRNEAPVEVEANDEKGAIGIWCAMTGYDQYLIDLNEVEIEEFLPPVKPMFVRVHLGFITVNLIPDLAKELGYKEGDRFKTEVDMFAAIGTQNIRIVEMWYNERNEKMPTDFLEAAKYMVEHTVNDN